MFGDISGMMSKLKETQQKVEETKQRLNNVLIDETSSDGNIKVTVTANKEIKAININDKLLSDNEELEDYLIITLNKALKKAGDINEHEMGMAAKDGMPNIPGMDFFK
ncbi:YbaB/EbfC family nucleoid-associated protein [Tenacibaculum maritimum]|uniref:YbaB/EbfC family nucleoid-associated protein n=1 Tax=Tenacibaculum maritimum TaxID=107401 RepID=UPI0012E6B338|nr:YbaB/EbfC family nucleoid-associated protein [Tenacibaculum maritimum]MCD9581931.1 YbaB/EbfC family nucleoid-associated protein [Tenacibaculum maritimum]MCD9634987.1 YbaB/EbfC family nucleoid-associated protein [Tenacibaculum maritimum]CAA0152348.1 nucleoid associated protein [Tenacibaculum maritimum]CAA0167216.1 nucleoid associated protein [Tenacibaculum maritimum]CAA0179543.1 nucleoid associated protein [Tenacibaculum maritimum]